jgi:hypothetical protein
MNNTFKTSDAPQNRKPRCDFCDRDALTGPHTITARPWIDPAHFGRLLHIKIVASREGTAVLTMPFLISTLYICPGPAPMACMSAARMTPAWATTRIFFSINSLRKES